MSTSLSAQSGNAIHINDFDTVRGLAALSVVASHYTLKLLDAPAESAAYAWWFGMTFTVLVTIGLAAFTHRYVELPSIALGKSIPRWFDVLKTQRLQSGQPSRDSEDE